jgi:ferredoxin
VTMKVIVDTELCEAHGDCVVSAPEVFDLDDDDNVVTVLDPNPPDDLREKVDEAVLMCPTSAISVEDG